MFAALKRFFTDDGLNAEVDKDKLVRHAAALLMLEVAAADEDYAAEERQVMLSHICSVYQLSAEEAEDLLKEVESDAEKAVSIHEFTRLLVEELDMQKRVEIIEMLWRVAWADGNLDRYEEHIIRRIADLLYVAHKDFIQAKLRICR